MTERKVQEYILDETEAEKVAYEEMLDREEEKEQNIQEQPMGDVYDVYAKAVGVHSKLSGMTEDYTLTRYNIDIYNQKFPKFVREQRKVLRIIKSFLIIPLSRLKILYNTEDQAKRVYAQLVREYKIVEELLLGELDECVIMARTPEGDVIKAFLQHGLNPENRDSYDIETEQPNIKRKLNERTQQ